MLHAAPTAQAAWAALQDSSATLLLTLAARASAHLRLPDLHWYDALASRVALSCPFALDPMAQDEGLVRGIILRSQIFDRHVLAASQQAAPLQIVTLGAGLCTRRSRLAAQLPADGLGWLNIDLPAVMALREHCIPAHLGGENRVGSLDDDGWLAQLDLPAGSRVLLLLEGVAPYVPASMVVTLLHALADACLARQWHGEILFDYLHPAMLSAPQQAGGMDLPVQGGFVDAQAMIHGHPGIRLIREVYPFAEFSPGHQRFADAFQQQHQRPPYAIACLSLGAVEPCDGLV